MIGITQTIISIADEAVLVEQFMAEFYQYCIKRNYRRNNTHQDYNPSDYLIALLKEIFDPTLSLCNRTKVLPSTQLLLNEGVPANKAYELSHYLSKVLLNRLCLLFPDLPYEKMANTDYTFINRYDIMILLTDQ